VILITESDNDVLKINFNLAFLIISFWTHNLDTKLNTFINF
jgi:hypothetical protein